MHHAHSLRFLAALAAAIIFRTIRTARIAARLLEKGYSAEDIRKIYGGNLLRVMRGVEAARWKNNNGSYACAGRSIGSSALPP